MAGDEGSEEGSAPSEVGTKLTPGEGSSGDPGQDAGAAPEDLAGKPELAESLRLQNQARAEVNSPPLSWNADLAKSAQAWADRCEFKHATGQSFEGQVFGENLAMGSSTFGLGSLTQLWMAEQSDFSCESNACGAVCGHYTQVIWRDTTEVGCAEQLCGGERLFVCRYLPAGNYVGQRPVPTEDCPG